ncbi:MAG TPA: phospholipase D-like domain-containing protein [Thermoanaerobaculia bacterium]|jgi:phosphatidylserine/phosphatidylglycerophosphate/cardiolipin synthase-like enzyme|nr:phospholipase D-like domain-containing protein [Thermoanaerobaculia bacterium]
MPLTFNPDDWFLDTRENPDTLVGPETVNNQVTELIDGACYMAKLYELLTSAGSGDFFWYAGLELNLDLELIDKNGQATVANVFREARERGVDIRVMLSNHLSNSNNRADRAFRKLDKPIECILDSRFRDFGSAHQKFSILFTDRAHAPDPADRLPEKQLHAFCGGIDLQVDRWDTMDHGELGTSGFRKFKDFPAGWHDVHALIRGDACVHFVLMFVERWNNPEPPRINERGPYTPIKQAVPAETTEPPGKHMVQVLRTYSCGYDELHVKPLPPMAGVPAGAVGATVEHVDYPFAKAGEFSARAACLKAIAKARDFIYIEDQYFFSYEIAIALRDALIAHEKLQVIVLVAQEPTGDKGTRLENYYHFRTLNGLALELVNGDRYQNFAIFDLRKPRKDSTEEDQIYVHAKLMIVDDLWVQIGSMNCNRRSMTHDLEAAVAIVDPETEPVQYGSYGVASKFARRLRLRLWREHLRVPDELIDDPTSGIRVWSDIADGKYAHVRHHEAASKIWRSAYLWRTIGDPQGTCAGADSIPDPWPET